MERMAHSHPRLLADNLQRILDCAVETQVVIRREDGRILQIFFLDPRSWRHLLEEQGSGVELRIGGRVFAHGVVVGGDEPGIRISSLVVRRS
jgi:flagellar motor switch/type III secretory pathway protein FliN